MLTYLTLGSLLVIAPPDDSSDIAADAEPAKSELEEPEAELTGPAYQRELDVLPEAEQDRDKAIALYQSASVAYGDARYTEAIEFFAEAYRAFPGFKNVLYSLGQAHRLQYDATSVDEHRRLAIRRYSQYMQEAPSGEFISDASRYLALLTAVGDDGPKVVTRVMISTPAEAAWMKVDGGESVPAPGIAIVEPGEHSVEVGGEGYVSQTKSIDVPEGATVQMTFSPAEMPATITVSGPKGAEVSVDGRSYGKLPLTTAISVEPGVHFVAVTRNGHVPYTRQIEVRRDEKLAVDAEMRNSTQRVLSYTLIGLGGGSVIASGIMMGLAFDAQTRALASDAKASRTPEEYDRYLELRDRRDQFRTASIASGAVGAGVLLTGIVLFAVDRPQVDVPLFDRERRAEPKPAGPTVAAAPVLGPDFAGAMGLVRF